MSANGIVFLILVTAVPVYRGPTVGVPQYIPMPSMEECQRLAPILARDARQGGPLTVARVRSTPFQPYGSPGIERWVTEETYQVRGPGAASASCKVL